MQRYSVTRPIPTSSGGFCLHSDVQALERENEGLKKRLSLFTEGMPDAGILTALSNMIHVNDGPEFLMAKLYLRRIAVMREGDHE